MLQAMAEARTLNDSGDTGERFRARLVQARDSYDLLLAHLISAEPSTAQYARGLADSMGNHLAELEAVLARPTSDMH